MYKKKPAKSKPRLKSNTLLIFTVEKEKTRLTTKPSKSATPKKDRFSISFFFEKIELAINKIPLKIINEITMIGANLLDLVFNLWLTKLLSKINHIIQFVILCCYYVKYY